MQKHIIALLSALSLVSAMPAGVTINISLKTADQQPVKSCEGAENGTPCVVLNFEGKELDGTCNTMVRYQPPD